MKDHSATGNPNQHLEAVQLSTSACLAKESPQWFTRVFKAFYNHFSSLLTAPEFMCHHIKFWAFFFQIPFCILLGSLGFVFLQRIRCKWPEQLCLGPAVTASLPDVLPEGFNRQLKFLRFSSFCGNNNWRSATEVRALIEKWFLRSPSNYTKCRKAAFANAKNIQERSKIHSCLQ